MMGMLVLILGAIVVAGWLRNSGAAGTLLPAAPDVEVQRGALSSQHIGLIAGHRGYDSGAICDDGRTEAETVGRIAEQARRGLERAGAQVDVLSEYDPSLEGYVADALVSIHADSCIERSGFKAAIWDEAPPGSGADRLLGCLALRYAAATGLTFDPHTVTTDMTEYHAFHRVDARTPAAIVETGYLGGDWAIIGDQPSLPAQGIVDSLLCFLEQ